MGFASSIGIANPRPSRVSDEILAVFMPMSKRIPLFDAHCDTSLSILEHGYDLYQNPGHLDLHRSVQFAPRVQIFAIFDEGTRIHYRRQMDHLKQALACNDAFVTLCTTGREAMAAAEAGKMAAMLSVEGAELLDCSVSGVHMAAADGVRFVNLTWNHANLLSGSNVEETDRGLSEDGRVFVRACEAENITVDVSHLSDPGFWDVIETAQKPVIASHSNSRSVWDHPRNLTDAQFCAIMQTGGVVGINLYSAFLGTQPTVDTVIRHIDHFLELGGAKHIGLGADFDGCDMLPAGFHGVSDMPVLYDALLSRGYQEQVVRDIFYDNFMRMLQRKECDVCNT